MIKIIFALLIAAVLSGCGEESATTWLKEHHYTNVELIGTSFNPLCGKYNGMHHNFTAINPTHQKITGTICNTGFFIYTTLERTV